MTVSEAGFDPFELPDTIQLEGVDDPYPYLAAARSNGPVQMEWPLPDDVAQADDAVPNDDDQWFSVLGHDEVMTVLRDHETYSSEVLAEIMGPMLGHTMIAMDEPDHRTHRALVAPAFRPKLLARWEDELIRRVVDEMIDSFAPLGRADLVRRLTFAFPVRVIARILGLPERDAPQFQRWSIELISIIVNWDRGIAASHALRDYFAEQVAERRARPRDDLISELVETEVDGRRLSDEEIFAFLRMLLPAGIETTYRSLGNLLFALLTHAEELDEVERNPDVRGTAIEEGLRWEPPLLTILRTATRDTVVDGVEVGAGSVIIVNMGSANHDEKYWESPEEFDIFRKQRQHLAFAFGPHMCVGMHLARMETRVTLTRIFDRLPNLRLDPDAAPPVIQGFAFRGPDAIPVLFDKS
jgi:cytochrome P450